MHPTNRRHAFTLVELLVVIGVMLLLAALTVGTINLSITSERTRGAARQVQSLLEGARDRAIYAQQPRGVRIQVNEQITEDHDNNGATPDIATLATTLVYIGSPGEDTSEPDITDDDGDGDTAELFKYINVVDATQFPRLPASPPGPLNVNELLATKAIIGVNTRWSALYEQGLIGPGTVIRISPSGVEDARQSSEFMTVDPRSFPVRTEEYWFGTNAPSPTPAINFNAPITPPANGNVNGIAPFSATNGQDEVLFLTYESDAIRDQMIGYTPSPPTPPGIISTNRWAYVMETNPDILPGEEPSFLPRNTCIDLHTSHLPDGWLRRNADGTRQYSSRMDLLFSPNGSIIGSEGAAGLVHLHVCDVADAMDNVPPGSPIYIPPASTVSEPRNGDEFGVTIFTRSGRVNVHPMIAVDLDLVTNTNPNVVEGRTYPPNGPLPAYGGTGQRTWMSIGYAQTDIVAPTVYNGLIYQLVSTGSAGTREPKWNLNPGGLTVDNQPGGGGGQVWRGIKHDVWSLGVEGALAK